MRVRVSLCYPDADPTPWLAGLRSHLPFAEISSWMPGAPLADYGVVWAPHQEFLDQQTQLKALFNIGAGVDRLMLLRLPPGLPVVRLDDAGMGVQMAEYVCHAVARHFREFDAYDAQAGQGQWLQRAPRSRADFPVGIMGLGVLGARVAAALKVFDYPLVGWSRSKRELDGVRCFSGMAGLAEFLARTRILVCLLPLTPDTRGILNRDTLSQLRLGAFVVNVARGDLLIEEDLLALLDSGHVAGATLDVFRTEPLPPLHPLWRRRAVHVTPHTSAQTLEAASIAQIAGKILAMDRGAPVSGMVDHPRGY